MVGKKMKLLIIIGIIFSSFFGLSHLEQETFAESKSTILVDEPFLNVSYKTESKDATNFFRIKFKRESKDQQNRIKLKLLNEKGEVINYPSIDGMEEIDDWLTEKEFTESADRELEVTLPKDQKKVQLFIELNEQTKEDREKTTNVAELDQDILGLTEPFLLEMPEETKATKMTNSAKKSEQKDTEQSTPKTTESSKVADKKNTNESFSLYSENGNATKLAMSEAGMSLSASAYSGLYNNKVPTYKTDKGKYPANSWQPEGQTNVINHQGGNEEDSGWDNLTSWNVSNDDLTKSYINYGNKNNPNLSLRKFAMETSTKDVFDVRMNVRGNFNYKPGVDIVFLLDNSFSMLTNNKKGDAVAAMKKLVAEIKKIHDPNSENIRMGAHIFSDYAAGHSTASTPISNLEADWDTIAAKYESSQADGNTFTERALLQSQDLFTSKDPDGTSGRKKLLFVLTDGAPTASFVPTKAVRDDSMFYNKVLVTESRTKDASGSYLAGSKLGNVHFVTGLPNAYSVSGLSINSHITTTNSVAKKLKDDNIEIHSIAFDINKAPLEMVHTQADLIKGLYKMSSKRADATGDAQKDYFFYETKNSSDLTEYLKNWYHTILRTVDSGKYSFTAGNYIEFIGNPVVKSVGKTTADLPTIQKTSQTFDITNLNLYGGQEIQLDYTVRLKTEQAGFVPGNWYPVSQDFVRLTPTPSRTTDLLDFQIPSVKSTKEDFVIQVKKVWTNDSSNKWGKRQEVTAVLQRKEGNGFIDLQEVPLNSSLSWENKFKAVDSTTSIVYRVVERVNGQDRVLGYASPTYNKTYFTSNSTPSGAVVITNKMLITDYTFKKFKEDGKPFTGTDIPKFTVTDLKSGQQIKNLVPDSSGNVKIQGLPEGTYTVSETTVPSGYKKMDDFKIVVTQSGNTVVAKVNGSPDSITVKNELSEKSLPVEKKWEDTHDGKENFWKLRQPLTAVLMKKSGSDWLYVSQAPLNAENKWKNSFLKVDTDPNITYKVVERVGNQPKVAGYKAPTYNTTEFSMSGVGSQGIVITNELMTTNYSFKKVKEDNEPFKGTAKDLPKFSLVETTRNIEVVKDVSPDADGMVQFTNLPIGTYRVSETFVPSNYKKCDDFEFTVTENSDGTGVFADNLNKVVVNKLRTYKIIVTKVDEGGKKLPGAEFVLHHDRKQYPVTVSSSGTTFTFDNLLPESYHLVETKAPENYVKLSKEYLIDIFESGNVNFSEEKDFPTITRSVAKGENQTVITVEVKNRRESAGFLPRTGSFGTQFFTVISVICLVLAGGLGIVYWIFNKRRGL